jgi:hypothetical protein
VQWSATMAQPTVAGTSSVCPSPVHNSGSVTLYFNLNRDTVKLNYVQKHHIQSGPCSPAALSTKNSFSRFWLLPEMLQETREIRQPARLRPAMSDTLAKDLAAMPNIKHLALSFLMFVDTEHDHIKSCWDYKELGDVLTNGYSTLESLKVAVKPASLAGVDLTRAKENWRILHTLIFLPSCTMLRILELARELIFGWEEEQSDELSTILPGSLKCLHFRGDVATWDRSPWIFNPLYKNIMNYLDSSGA